MKKMTTFAAASLLAIGTYGQTCIDFEDKELNVNPDGYWTAGTVEDNRVVENPDKSGLNPSDRCYCLVVKSNDATLGINGLFALEGNKRVSFLMKKATNGNAKMNLETITNNEGEGEIKHNRSVFAWYDGGDEWRRVVCDFSTDDLFYDPTLVMITPQEWNVPAEGVTVYLDDIRVEPMPRVNGVPVWEADLEGAGALQLTGHWLRGECQKENFDEANKVRFDDYTALSERMKPVTSVDLRGAAWTDGYHMFSDANPNCLIYAKAGATGTNVIVDGTAEQVNLSEGGDFSVPESFTAKNIQYTRDFANTGWFSTTLPFAPTNLGELQFEELANVKNANGATSLIFTPVASPEAGKPYIVHVGNTGEQTFTATNVAVNNTTQETTGTGAVMKPCYATMSGEGKYMLKADGSAFAKGNASSTIGAFRAYIELTNTGSGAPARLLVNHSNGENGGATSLEGTHVMQTTDGLVGIYADTAQEVLVYSANGQLVDRLHLSEGFNTLSHLPKGLYLVNQQKLIIR